MLRKKICPWGFEQKCNMIGIKFVHVVSSCCGKRRSGVGWRRQKNIAKIQAICMGGLNQNVTTRGSTN